MQISRSSSDQLPFHLLPDEVPTGKRALEIKWTDEEWRKIATAVCEKHPAFLEGTGFADIKAWHVFEAQSTCLPPSRQRQLILIAQDFSAKRGKIVKTLTTMHGRRVSGQFPMRPIGSSSCEQDTACSSGYQLNETSTVEAQYASQRTPVDECMSKPDKPATRNGLVVLAQPSVSTIVWAPEELACVARALLETEVAVWEGKGDEGLTAESIYAAQHVLPESRHRDLPSIQARLTDDQARIRNILDVIRVDSPSVNAIVERKPPKSIFRADSSGTVFTRFAPEDLGESCPDYRSSRSNDMAHLVGYKTKPSVFPQALLAKLERPPVRRPEVEKAIAEIFGPASDESQPALETSESATQTVDPVSSPLADTAHNGKRAFIRWNEAEWQQVTRRLVERAGGQADVQTYAFITPLAVHAAQDRLTEDRRRTVGSVYSGFASTKKKLSEIAAQIVVEPPAKDHYGHAQGSMVTETASEATVALDDLWVGSAEALPTLVSENAPSVDVRVADAPGSHSLDHKPASNTALGEAVLPVPEPLSAIEAARPFVRMLCEEFWGAAVRHFLPHFAVHSEENK